MNNREIDKRLKEIEEEVVLLSDYLGEAVEKKLGKQIGDIQQRLDRIQKSGLGTGGGKIDISGLTKDFAGLHDELGKLVRSVGTSEYSDEKDNLTLRLKTVSGTIMKGLISLEKNIQGGVKKASEDQEKLKQTVIKNIENLRATAETIRQICTVDGKKTLGGEVAIIEEKVESISKQIPEFTKSVTQGLSSLEKKAQVTASHAESMQEAVKNNLLENLDSVKTSVEDIRQQFSLEKDITLGGEIELISGRIEKLHDEIPGSTQSLQQGLSSLDNNLKESTQQTTAKQDEIKNDLINNLANLDENIEVVRRMCSTDDEKYLGSLMSFVNRRVEEMSDQLPELAENVKKWLLTVDKNVQTAARQTSAKQDEVKKILLYDINKLNETAETIRHSCATQEDRPLGSEMIQVSDRVEKMSEELPETLGKVTALSDQLDRVSSEVKLMRWFVVAAVVISIIVLAASFFT